MKKSNVSFKLLTIITVFLIIGCFQLAASQAQPAGSSDKVPVTIFDNAYRHIPGLEKDADKIIIGEGEILLLKLLEYVISYQPVDLKSILKI